MNYKSEADKILKNYNILNIAVKNIEEDIEILDEELTDLKAISYDSEIKGSYFTNDRNNNLLYKKSIQEENLKITKLKINHIDNILDKMNDKFPEETEFIKQRYFKGLEMEEFVDLFHRSIRQVYRLRDRSLSVFAVSYFGLKAIV
ncbi:MAG: hypothetical protein ACRC7R_03405 [Sarcina sp.]